MAKKYDESSIKNLSGLQAIRQRPAMYAGDSGSGGMWTALRELLDNGCDENGNGRNDLVWFIQHSADTFSVVDNGPGIPVGDITVENPIDHKKVKISALKGIVALTHTGGKFDGDAYGDGSRGTHGVGIKLTNAVSARFDVYTYRDRKWWHLAYEKGREVEGLKECKPPRPDEQHKPLKRGTLITVKIDFSVFDKGTKFHEADLLRWIEVTSAMSEGLVLRYTNIEGEDKEWECEGALTYLNRKLEDSKASLVADDAIFSMRTKTVDIAFAFTSFEAATISGFTNGLLNKDGGEHVTAVYAAVARSVKPYATKAQDFSYADMREGLFGLVNVKLTAPKFNNQAKERLVDDRGGKPVENILLEELTAYFDADHKLAKLLCERASQMRTLRDQFSKSKALVKTLATARKKNSLPAKLALSNCTDAERELFIVEGDSAGGCFSAATLVQLADGRTLSFSDLVADFAKGIDHEGLTYDVKNKRFETFTFDHPRVTKHVTSLVELTLDNGEVVTCTPEHPWLLTDGTYKRADQLTEDDAIQEFPRPGVASA